MAKKKGTLNGTRPKVRIPPELLKASVNLKEIANLRYNTQAFRVMSEVIPQKILSIKEEKKKKRLRIIWEQEFKL
jgi:hypothetical protein